MNASFDDLIKAPEPWLLNALHGAKVTLAGLMLLSIPVGVAGAVLGFGRNIWLYVFFALMAGATLVALVANRWSKSLFARRAEQLGLDASEARSFWRTYDWDQDDDA